MRPKPYSCGLEAALELLDGKWKPLILRAIRKHQKRFGELRHAVSGISEKMLIEHLKEVETDGLIVRTDFREKPPRVEYSLSALGVSLIDAMLPLCEWGSQHMAQIETLKTTSSVRDAVTQPRQLVQRKGETEPICVFLDRPAPPLEETQTMPPQGRSNKETIHTLHQMESSEKGRRGASPVGVSEGQSRVSHFRS